MPDCGGRGPDALWGRRVVPPTRARLGVQARPPPTASQVGAARAVTRWYLERYHDTPHDVGVASMFTDPGRVGAFAVAEADLAAGEPDALFKVLVATTMFQRRQDLQIMRVLRGLGQEDVEELTSPARLLALAGQSGCPNATSLSGLLTRCDLRKDERRLGACHAQPSIECAPKRHAVLLKRYGHFGKVPTGLALALRERDCADLGELRERALRAGDGPSDAAARLEAALCAAWRVSDKIAAMFLSAVSNPDLCPGIAPWEQGLDWRRWVVIDSNVDLFLRWIGYDGPMTYGARRAFLIALAARVDISSIKPSLRADNPRIVQQAAYLFMSVTNRRASAADCAREGVCESCSPTLASGCGLAGRGLRLA